MHYIKIQRMIIYKFICSINKYKFVKDNILLHEIYSIQ